MATSESKDALPEKKEWCAEVTLKAESKRPAASSLNMIETRTDQAADDGRNSIVVDNIAQLCQNGYRVEANGYSCKELSEDDCTSAEEDWNRRLQEEMAKPFVAPDLTAKFSDDPESFTAKARKILRGEKL